MMGLEGVAVTGKEAGDSSAVLFLGEVTMWGNKAEMWGRHG